MADAPEDQGQYQPQRNKDQQQQRPDRRPLTRARAMKTTAATSCTMRIPAATRPCSEPVSPRSSSTLMTKTALAHV